MSSRRPRGKHARPPSRHLTKATYAIAGGTVIAATPLVTGTAAFAAETPALSGTGTVSMIHAVPGLVADVSVDGKEVLTDFVASRVTDPVTLSAGPHTVAVKADNGPQAGKTVLTATLDVTAGSTSTAVVGLTADGKPKAYVFAETPQPVPNGKAGMTIRSVAATDAATVVIDGYIVPRTFTGGSAYTADVPAGPHEVYVRDASNGSTLLDGQSAPLQADRVTTLYLTGSAADKTLSWVATTRLASSVTPLSAVPTGDGSTVLAGVTSPGSSDVGAAGTIAGLSGIATYAVMRRRARHSATDPLVHAES